MIALIAIAVLTCFALVSWIKNAIIKEPVNICNQTMAEANDPINWHDGIYSPVGCDLTKK